MKPFFVLVVITSLLTTLRAVDTSKPFDLTTILGEKFKNCHITKATPEGLTIVHDKGVVRVSFTLLDDEWKEQFHYDPEQAHTYAVAEEAKRKVAEAKRAEMNRKRELSEEAQLAELAAAERRRLETEAREVKEYHDSVRVANTPPTPLAPLPGDTTPALSAPPLQQPIMQQPIMQQPVMQTEVVMPTVTPVGDPFTPARIHSQTYITPGGYGGYPYGYYTPYQPIYGYPGCGYGMAPCPTSSTIPGVHGTISTGGMTLHVGH